IGTAITLLYNGIVLGAISGYLINHVHGDRFQSFVISHGSFELTDIAVAGGAGLIMGDALVHPRERTRLDSLRSRGGEAIQIACGAAVMLMIAALIEAFWSPSSAPSTWKYVIGTLFWVLVYSYLAFAGRGGPAEADQEKQPHAV
ncbi:MAG TPA: stage II sporulation protein M, partial [Planctomycetaceae bacterium]|nr:stage II sporulation protein M [Planctomycetaceae bacterium]